VGHKIISDFRPTCCSNSETVQDRAKVTTGVGAEFNASRSPDTIYGSS